MRKAAITAPMVVSSIKLKTRVNRLATAGLRLAQRRVLLDRADWPGQDGQAGQVSPQVLGQLGGGRVPLRLRFLQAFQADRLQVAGQLRFSWRGGTGWLSVTFCRIKPIDEPVNGTRPVNNSYRITPSA
jgi:hypothetical protein